MSSVGGVAAPGPDLPPPSLGAAAAASNPSSSGLTVRSGTVTNVSSLLVETERTPEPPQTILPTTHTVEINPDPSLPPPEPIPPLSSSSSSSVAAVVAALVTGTGSMTATPSVYTTAVMTTATTTTSVTPGQTQGQLLGKRVRRQSSKYEDYEQQTLSTVSCVSLSVCVFLSLCVLGVIVSVLPAEVQPHLSWDTRNSCQGRDKDDQPVAVPTQGHPSSLETPLRLALPQTSRSSVTQLAS